MKLKFAVVALMLSATGVQAQGIINLSHVSDPGSMQFSAGFSAHEFDIEFDNGGPSAEVEKKVLGAGVSFGLEYNLNIYGYGGFSFASELERVPGDDTGFLVGGGAKYKAFENEHLEVIAYSELSYAADEFGSGVEGTLFEFKLGGLASKEFNPRVAAYGGVLLVPFSDGEVDGGATSVDAERDDNFGVFVGANFTFDRINVRPEVGLGNESRFSIFVDMAI